MKTILPTELWSEILVYALTAHPRMTDVICTNNTWKTLSLQILHSDLSFTSTKQLRRFNICGSLQINPLMSRPRSLSIDLGGSDYRDVFLYLRDTLHLLSKNPSSAVDEDGRLVLDALNLRLNSYSSDPQIGLIYEALCCSNPRAFTWVGCDPPHHFSTSIVQRATPYLFRALSTFSKLRNLTLTHIAFENIESGNASDRFTANRSIFLLLSGIPSLQEFYLGQAVFVSESTIADLLFSLWDISQCSRNRFILEKFRLVDVYKESIWGNRLKRGDIETALLNLAFSTWRTKENNIQPAILELPQEIKYSLITFVESLVVCEGKTERLMGGDRVKEGSSFLF